jgi:hypothetical protein
MQAVASAKFKYKLNELQLTASPFVRPPNIGEILLQIPIIYLRGPVNPKLSFMLKRIRIKSTVS